jgi:hypothetical protein
MNIYFLSLLKVDFVRKKNRYSTFKLENKPDDVEDYLFSRFNIQSGDCIRIGFDTYYFGQIPWNLTLKGRGPFHPLHFYGSGQGHFLSNEIVRKMIRNNPQPNLSFSINFKVKINKAKYLVICHSTHYTYLMNLIEKRIKNEVLFSVKFNIDDEHPQFILHFYP